MQQYKVAGYVRLSKEDKIKDESNSITNQKAIINSFIKSSIIVKKIFDMISSGKSRKEVADFLNDNNVLTPSLYKIDKEGTNNEEFALSKKWNAEIVNRILRNETYTGTLIQNIKTKPNYGENKLIDVNKEDWIKTKNHHEAIISKDKFDEVQQILDKKIKVNKNNQIDFFQVIKNVFIVAST